MSDGEGGRKFLRRAEDVLSGLCDHCDLGHEDAACCCDLPAAAPANDWSNQTRGSEVLTRLPEMQWTAFVPRYRWHVTEDSRMLIVDDGPGRERVMTWKNGTLDIRVRHEGQE